MSLLVYDSRIAARKKIVSCRLDHSLNDYKDHYSGSSHGTKVSDFLPYPVVKHPDSTPGGHKWVTCVVLCHIRICRQVHAYKLKAHARPRLHRVINLFVISMRRGMFEVDLTI